MSTLVADAATVEFAGQEPWPENVKLYQPYEVGQILMTDFACCLSVKTFLNMLGLQYQVELRTNAEYMSPSGKLPFIRIGPLLVSELDPIISHVSAKGYTLSADLNDEQRSEMKAYMGMVENILVNAEMYLAWCDKEIADVVTKPRYGSPYPWPLNYLLPLKKQFGVCRKLKGNGWAKKSFTEVCDEITQCCQGLSEKLGDQKFFFGDKPSDLDALVYGHLYTILTTNLPTTKLAEIIESFENLSNFVRQIDKIYFEEIELQHD